MVEAALALLCQVRCTIRSKLSSCSPRPWPRCSEEGRQRREPRTGSNKEFVTWWPASVPRHVESEGNVMHLLGQENVAELDMRDGRGCLFTTLSSLGVKWSQVQILSARPELLQYRGGFGEIRSRLFCTQWVYVWQRGWRPACRRALTDVTNFVTRSAYRVWSGVPPEGCLACLAPLGRPRGLSTRSTRDTAPPVHPRGEH